MTSEERAAIEARDNRSYSANENFYTGVEWRVITDRHALLDELRRVEAKCEVECKKAVHLLEWAEELQAENQTMRKALVMYVGTGEGRDFAAETLAKLKGEKDDKPMGGC